MVENMAARLAMTCRKLDRAQALASRLEELLDDVARDLGDLCELAMISTGSPPNSKQVPSSLRAPRRARRLSGEAPPGVATVHLVPQGDGSATAHIDGRLGIRLPPFVAALLTVLKSDAGIGRDHLVGWKPMAYLQTALKEHTNQYHSKAAVKELIYRLRILLERHGENPFLVQHKRRLGYRFAVRCCKGGVADRTDQ
jgi:hypothetical protein